MLFLTLIKVRIDRSWSFLAALSTTPQETPNLSSHYPSITSTPDLVSSFYGIMSRNRVVSGNEFLEIVLTFFPYN